MSQLLPDSTENFTNEPTAEICMKNTASIDVTIKKHPMEDVGQESLSKPLPNEPENLANGKLTRQNLDFSRDNGSKKLNEIASAEVKTCGKKKLQMNLLKKKPALFYAGVGQDQHEDH